VLGIPFYVWDLSAQFTAAVVDDFVAEYEAGRTPNPCIRCNEQIKFATVLDRALTLGFDSVCTGHYARLRRTGDRCQLHRAADPNKDQSYVLGVLDQSQLQHSMFPLGTSLKPEVRDEAAQRGLLVADKPDSHDICFISDGDTAGFLRDRLGPRPGPVVDEQGQVLGTHEGAYAFTVGQRRGLALGAPAPDGRPRYVLSIEPRSGTVTVGPKDRLGAASFVAPLPRWCDGAPGLPGRFLVQTRAHGSPVEVEVEVDVDRDGVPAGVRVGAVGGTISAVPGQTAVFYRDTLVVGSTTIDTVVSV